MEEADGPVEGRTEGSGLPRARKAKRKAQRDASQPESSRAAEEEAEQDFWAAEGDAMLAAQLDSEWGGGQVLYKSQS